MRKTDFYHLYINMTYIVHVPAFDVYEFHTEICFDLESFFSLP